MLVGQDGKQGKEPCQVEAQQPRAVFPVGEAEGVGEINEDELICQPCEEEEQSANPGSLPSVYQPTR